MSARSRVSRGNGPRAQQAVGSTAGLWFLALAMPGISAVVAWLWFGLAISAATCASSRAHMTIPELGPPNVISPAVVALFARRSRPPRPAACAAIAVSAVLALIVVRLTLMLWWSVSDCPQ